jgi:poly(hydroxyalkanoate) depolymerase family esterase
MPSLVTVLEDVRSGRRPPWPCRPNPSAVQSPRSPFPSQAQGLSEITDFGSNPGHLRMLKLVPPGLRARSPLVVVLHGCGQSSDDINDGLGWSTLADECGFALLFPEQRRSNNAQRGFNWFRPADSRRGCGEALSIVQMVQHLIDNHGLDSRRVYVTGLSAGGAMASALLAAYPDVFAGGAILAGLPFGVASNLWGALAAMKGKVNPSSNDLGDKVRAASPHQDRWPALSIWHGSSDKTVAPSNADAIIRQWCNVHGLCEEAAIETRVAGKTRRLWCDDAGLPVIERFIIPGMGHGAPVDALGTSGYAYGAAAPFFEDQGISSTYHIAKFWGLASLPPRFRKAVSRAA